MPVKDKEVLIILIKWTQEKWQMIQHTLGPSDAFQTVLFLSKIRLFEGSVRPTPSVQSELLRFSSFYVNKGGKSEQKQEASVLVNNGKRNFKLLMAKPCSVCML